MSKEDLRKLRHYHARLATVLNELEVLEDFENYSYDEIVTDIGFITVGLEQRRERLQRRGRTL